MPLLEAMLFPSSQPPTVVPGTYSGKQSATTKHARRRLVIILLTLTLLLSACRTQRQNDTRELITREVTRVVSEIVTVEPSPIVVTRIVEEYVEVTSVPTLEPTPTPSEELTVCMVNEPTSLYLYDTPLFGVAALAKQAVLHAVYENLYTTLSYSYQAQGLEKLPALDDGDAEIVSFLASAGDTVIDINNEVVELADGITVRDSNGNEHLFDDTPVNMAQMIVRFRLRPMVWSDGIPATAKDSRFSFEIASDSDTQGDKSRIQRTAGYQVIDDLTLQWTGVPGWLDPAYFTNIWPLLPSHQLSHFTAEELSETQETMVTPLSTGPFVIVEWVPGDYIRMVKNEHYYRSDDGLPNLDSVTFSFVQNPNQLMALLLAGQCDIGTQDGIDLTQAALLREAQLNGLINPHYQLNNVFEHIDFGINPIEAYESTRPDWFEDVRVRQAMVMCTDRQTMVDELLQGMSEVAHAYVPAVHPIYPAGISEWPYDVESANELLDQAGYVDRTGEGVRQDPSTLEPFHVMLGINLGNQMRQTIAQMFQANMTDCGIEIELFPQSAAEWFAPEGPLFGRRFDLAQFPWITNSTPACDLYLSSRIPSKENGWLGNNETGWTNSEFDAACEMALSSPIGSDGYRESHEEALRIFSEQVPVIPLFSHLKLTVTNPKLENFAFDPTQDSELWNLYELDLAP